MNYNLYTVERMARDIRNQRADEARVYRLLKKARENLARRGK